MNSFRELCQKRRSIRTFSSQPVEREKIDYILQCALMSPSGKRLNPWEFVAHGYLAGRWSDSRRAYTACSRGAGLGRMLVPHLRQGGVGSNGSQPDRYTREV